jgi:hypothetical protein
VKSRSDIFPLRRAIKQKFAGVSAALSKIATVDQDATIIESRKREALYTYEGSRGY